MKKLLFIAVVVILVIGGFSWWFWSLGSLPPVPPRQVTLRVESPAVSVREPGGSVWKPATDGMIIGEGWSVKTDSAGHATIVVADEAESRLDADSDVTLTKAMLDIQSGVNVQISLSMGRVWTRVLRFFDLGSSYAVKTSAVVATVRGTAFEVATSATGTSVSVNDSAVDVAPVGIAATTTDVVAAGSVATYSPSGRALERRALTADDRNAEWFSRNVAADMAFDERVVNSRTAELQALDGVAPGSALAGLAALSQRAHLAVAPKDARGPLADRYVERRLAQIMSLVNVGKSGQAAQEFARLENEMKSQATSAEDRLRMQRALAAIAPIVELADVNSPVFPFRQRVESLTNVVTDPKASSGIFARLLAVEDRIDEAERFISANSLEEAGIALDGAKSGIENVVRESAPLLGGFTAEDRRAIEGKIAALQARAAAARTALNAATAAGSATSTSALPPESATSTEPGIAPPFASSTPSTALDAVSISISLTPATLKVGEKGMIHVMAALRNGGSADVSAYSAFAINDDKVAYLNGLEVTGLENGSATLNASYVTAGGKTLTAFAPVSVSGSAVPASISMTSSNGSSLVRGQATLFAVTVRYGDGHTKIVTTNTAFTLGQGSPGSLSGASYLAADPGTATVMAAYTENGKTVTARYPITVAAPPLNATSTAPVIPPSGGSGATGTGTPSSGGGGGSGSTASSSSGGGGGSSATSTP
jgi:hypothetical protein